ncbi:MAG: hypothetical protein ABSG59_03070 [Verrucomicrobiota bacterium]
MSTIYAHCSGTLPGRIRRRVRRASAASIVPAILAPPATDFAAKAQSRHDNYK